jgi:hypothetical protein
MHFRTGNNWQQPGSIMFLDSRNNEIVNPEQRSLQCSSDNGTIEIGIGKQGVCGLEVAEHWKQRCWEII